MSARVEPVAGGVPEGEPVTASRRQAEATLAGAVLLVALSLLWFWWAWRSGAYFGVVFYPGAIGLGLAVAVLLALAPAPGSLRSWSVPVVIVGLLLLGAWTLLSALWSPSPDEAFSDGTRVLSYAAAFALGLWLCRLLGGRRAPLSLLPLALAGGAAGLGTAITLATGDDFTRYLSRDGTLEFPLGYHNANAAFFLIALWPALALAASPQVDWRLRGPMLGCAVLCAQVGFLSQSRGSLVGLAAGVFVWLLVSPYRGRALVWLLLGGAATAIAFPALSEVYTTFKDSAPLGPALDDAGRSMVLTAAGATLVGLVAARLVPAPRRPGTETKSLILPFAAMIAVVVIGVLAAFAVAAEDPADWVDQRLSELGRTGTPELSAEQSRFGFNATSQRPDQWRVAWDDASDEPLFGQGAGAFQFSYTRERDADLTARDAHSVEMELLGELGFPALLMLAAIVVGGAACALRSRSVGPGSATLAAGALGAGAYWIAHTSIDWFWAYPAVTAPVFCLIGAAAAPALSGARGTRGGIARVAVAVAVAVIALATVPQFLSERYVNDAYRSWGSDLQGAYNDLDAAQGLDPLSDDAFLAEGSIAREAGDRNRAIKAFREAIDRTPDEWVGHLYLGELLAQENPEAARREFEIAAELNPRSRPVQQALDEVREQGGA